MTVTTPTSPQALSAAKEVLELDRRMSRCCTQLADLISAGNAALQARISVDDLGMDESSDAASAESISTSVATRVQHASTDAIQRSQDAILRQALAIVEQSECEARKAARDDLYSLLRSRVVFPGAWPVASDVALRAVIDSRINPRTTVFEYQINFTSWEAATELGWLAVSIDTFHRKCRGAGKCAGHGEITTTPEIMGMSWVSDLTSLGPAMVHASRLNGAEVEYKISSSVWEPATRLGTLFADNIDFVAERLLLFHEQHNEKPRPEGDYLNAWCP